MCIRDSPCFPRMASQRSGSYSLSSGDHYNSEKAGASCWSPRTWHTDGSFGLRAEDTAPRTFAPRDSGRPIRVRTTREVRLAGLSPLPVALQLRRGADPSLKNQTCSLRAKPACCDFGRLAHRISQHRSANSKRMPRYHFSILILVLPAGLELCPRAGILESRRNNRRVAVCRGSTDPVLICGKSHAVLRGTSRDYGGRSKWAYASLGSGVSARATPFCPFLAKTGGSRWDFSRYISFFFPVRAYRRFI